MYKSLSKSQNIFLIFYLFTVEQEGALTDEEIQEIADKEGLQQLREKFTDLEEELEREAVEDENLPEGVERMLQGMIRLCRQMMAGGPTNTHEVPSIIYVSC